MSPSSAQRSMGATTGWVVALTGVGSLMAALDTLVVSTAPSTIRLGMSILLIPHHPSRAQEVMR